MPGIGEIDAHVRKDIGQCKNGVLHELCTHSVFATLSTGCRACARDGLGCSTAKSPGALAQSLGPFIGGDLVTGIDNSLRAGVGAPSVTTFGSC
jgi:hypothetical protein